MGIVRWLRRLVILGAVVFVVTVCAVVASALWNLKHYAADREFPEKLDAILVLGSGIDPDLVLSYSSRRRVRTAVYLLERNLTDRLIFSGGKVSSDGPKIGDLMKELAIDLGADPAALFVEQQSTTTWENLRFVYPLLEDMGGKFGLLTDPTHLHRSLVLNAYLGGPDMTPIASFGQFYENKVIRALQVSREALAWWYNLGKITAWEVTGLLGLSDDQRAKFVF